MDKMVEIHFWGYIPGLRCSPFAYTEKSSQVPYICTQGIRELLWFPALDERNPLNKTTSTEKYTSGHKPNEI
jgi:hypothetical protein